MEMAVYTDVPQEDKIERSVVSGMSSGLWTTMLLIAVLLGGLYLLPARDEAGPPKLTPFNTYIEGVRNAKPTDFVGHADSRVTDADAFEEMRQYILSRYRGVHVAHSYLQGSQVFDCVPVEQQPSLREPRAESISSQPPDLIKPSHSGGDRPDNSPGCEAHTIPMRRITLEQLSRFGSLKDFFKKAPGGGGTPDPGQGHYRDRSPRE
jgi:hypothetical protein